MGESQQEANRLVTMLTKTGGSMFVGNEYLSIRNKRA